MSEERFWKIVMLSVANLLDSVECARAVARLHINGAEPTIHEVRFALAIAESLAGGEMP